jgi:hypothetical protein
MPTDGACGRACNLSAEGSANRVRGTSRVTHLISFWTRSTADAVPHCLKFIIELAACSSRMPLLQNSDAHRAGDPCSILRRRDGKRHCVASQVRHNRPRDGEHGGVEQGKNVKPKGNVSSFHRHNLVRQRLVPRQHVRRLKTFSLRVVRKMREQRIPGRNAVAADDTR